MKKYLIIAFLILLPNLSFATSGTCSSHGGVNCSAGADSDGSAICNDGWRDSTESLYSVDMCFSNLGCTSSELSSLQQKYELQDTITKINSLKQEILDNTNQLNQLEIQQQSDIAVAENALASMSSINARIARIQSDYEMKESPIKNTISGDQRMLNIYNSSFSSTQSLIDSECRTLGADRAYQRQLDSLKALLEKPVQTPPPVLPQIPTPTPTCGENSSYKNGGCFCNEGFGSRNGSKCITYNQMCQEVNNNDPNMTGSKPVDGNSICTCKLGYSWNGSQCIVISTTPVVAQKLIPETKKVTPEVVKIPQTTKKILDNVVKPKPQEIKPSVIKDSGVVKVEQKKENAPQVSQEPIKKISWYQRIFNWLFK